MNDLGICPETNAAYEGSHTTVATRIVPTPLILPIRFFGREGVKPIDNIGGYSAEVFREEYFDPVTKIRRGRVYTRRMRSATAAEWHVHDPIRLDLPSEPWAHGRAQTIRLVTYATDHLHELRNAESVTHRPKVLLGWEEHCTLWQIVAIETPIRSGPMLTLKMLHSLGDLPELVEEKIPDAIRPSVLEAWEKVDSTLNRFSATEVVDRCRDFLSIVFGHIVGESHRDLADSVNAYMKNKKTEDVHASAGRIVARLHSRCKPNEQIARGLRPVVDADAQLAIRCVGVILQDLGWAR